jgi:DNA-binding transcriptional LysR family regulator
MGMSLDLRQLRHFVEVVRHRNYAQAAQSLGLSQPTLSRSVQALERQLGTRLLDRGRRGAELTPVGRLLFERARELLHQARETEREIGLLLGLDTGFLRIGTGAYPAQISVGTAVARLVQRHPGLTVDVAIDDWSQLIEQVVEGSIDLAVAELAGAENDERLAVQPLPQHQGWFFCRAGHPLASAETPTFDDIKRFPLASTSIPPRLQRLLPSGGAEAPVSLGRTRVDTFDLMCRVVRETDAIGMASHTMLANDLEAPRFVLLPIEVPWLVTRYGIIQLARHTPSPSAVAFIELLGEVEAEVAAVRDTL